MHPLSQQELMRVEKYRLEQLARRSQQINFVAGLRRRRRFLTELMDRFRGLLARLKRTPSSRSAHFGRALDKT